MENNMEHIDSSKIEEEAARWQARMHNDDLSSEEHSAFQEWLSASPENKRTFFELEKTMTKTDEFEIDVLAQKLDRDLRKHVFWDHSLPRAATIAAPVVLIVAIVNLAVFSPFSRNDVRIATTNIGQSEKIILSDGSSAELNTDTHLEVKYTGHTRTAALTHGEVFFDVEKDERRPFVVTTPQAVISVTGTSFNIEAVDASVEISVISGAVNVQPGSGDVVSIPAGFSVKVLNDGRTSPVNALISEDILSWRTGKLKFQEAALADVVRELNRYHTTPIELADPSIYNLPVTAEFFMKDQDSSVRALAYIFSLEVEKQPDRIVLSRKTE